MLKQTLLLAATVLLTSGVAFPQNQSQSPQQYDKSGAPSGLQSTTPDKPPIVTLPDANAPAPDASAAFQAETTDQARTFEDRWSAQAGVPYLPPHTSLPNAPAPETTGKGK